MAARSLEHRGNWPAAPVIYQIYPRSFMDSDGDGVGDLRGIIAKLEHVALLGVDAIWLSPFYKSAWKDGGYDVVNHTAVDPMMGTESDFDALVERAHSLGLLVAIDQVLNHTSDQHPWFIAALEGDEACAQRYLFRDAKEDGTPPNNWMSQFGMPGWSWAPRRAQYYFHQFLDCQPSLNLRSEEVQRSHASQIAHWRSRGVDGFRFDAVSSYLWDESLADNPPADPETRRKTASPDNSPYSWQDHRYDMLPGDGADYMRKLRQWAGEDAYLFGEITSGNKSVEIAMDFTGEDKLDACYTTDLPESGAAPDCVVDVFKQCEDPQRLVHWLSSHDQPRHVRGGPHSVEQAKAMAQMMAFLPGPWLIYQGEEFGLPNPQLERAEITDPFDLRFWPNHPGRENARVPVAWTAVGPNYGFTTESPWLPMRWQSSEAARDEVWSLYRDLIAQRRREGWGTATLESAQAHGDHLTLQTVTDEACLTGKFELGESWSARTEVTNRAVPA